jgi:rubrerythrin
LPWGINTILFFQKYNNMQDKNFWRCTICGDQHWGVAAPEACPTCGFPRDKAVEISKEEFLKTFAEKK